MLNRLIFILLSTLAIGILYSCGSGNTEEQLAIQKEVMAVHDEIMPKMDDIHRLQKGLIAQTEGLMADTMNLQPQLILSLEEATTRLQEAEEAMMQWMHDFEPTPGEKSHEAYMEYMQEEKARITEVKTQMLESISNAEALVK